MTPQTKRKRNQNTPSPQDIETNKRTTKRTHMDTFDASKELEISQNNSTIIQQYENPNLAETLADIPYNQTVFNKFSLVRRSSTPIT